MQYRTTSRGDVAELLSIAFPLVVSQGCETLMMFTGRLFLSRLGSEYMAAAMGGGLTCFMLTTFFVGLTGYTNALVAQYYGSGQPERCGLAAGQALIISLAAYPLLLAAIPIGTALFHAVGVPENQLGPQTTYFTIAMLGTVISLARGTLGSFFSGIGRTRIVMVSAATCLVVNVGAAYVLIFGKLGLPALGIAGAGIGMLVAGASGLLVLIAAYLLQENRLDYGTVAGLRWHWPTMTKLLRLGAPSGAELFLNLLAFNLLVLVFHSRGPEVAAAVTVAFNWDMMSFIPLIGINIGVASLVGRNMGARRPDLAHRVTMSGIKLVCVYISIIILTYSLLPTVLAGLFLSPADGEAWRLAVFMVRLVSVYVFADALGLVFSGALRGAGDTFATMCLSVSTHWVLLLTTVFNLRVLQASPRAAWIVLVILIWTIGGAFYLRYRTGHWRTLRVVGDTPGAE